MSRFAFGLCVPLRPLRLALFKPINQLQRTQRYAEENYAG